MAHSQCLMAVGFAAFCNFDRVPYSCSEYKWFEERKDACIQLKFHAVWNHCILFLLCFKNNKNICQE